MPDRGKKEADMAVTGFDDSGPDRRAGLFLWADDAAEERDSVRWGAGEDRH